MAWRRTSGQGLSYHCVVVRSRGGQVTCEAREMVQRQITFGKVAGREVWDGIFITREVVREPVLRKCVEGELQMQYGGRERSGKIFGLSFG